MHAQHGAWQQRLRHELWLRRPGTAAVGARGAEQQRGGPPPQLGGPPPPRRVAMTPAASACCEVQCWICFGRSNVGLQEHVSMHGDFMPQFSTQFACIRFVVFLCVEDPIGLSADSGNPILGISDFGISPIVLLARSLAEFSFSESLLSVRGPKRHTSICSERPRIDLRPDDRESTS